MNKIHDYRALEREFVTADISLRELCRRHGISAHSSVVVQAQKGKWKEKREAYQAKASESFISRHAERMADRQAQISDRALDAIDEAITRFREDLRATKPVRQADGEVAAEPVLRIVPRDVVLLIDRFNVLFERPSRINEERSLKSGVSDEPIPVDTLRELVNVTRGRAAPQEGRESPLPRSPDHLED